LTRENQIFQRDRRTSPCINGDLVVSIPSPWPLGGVSRCPRTLRAHGMGGVSRHPPAVSPPALFQTLRRIRAVVQRTRVSEPFSPSGHHGLRRHRAL
jgi:hypothetical protein